MKYIIAIFAAITLSGCATISDIVPSFWDDNQSKVAIDIKYNISIIDCASDNINTKQILRDVNWFISYSESKQTKDVIKIINPLKETLVAFDKKVETNKMTNTYCELKKKILITQSNRFAESVLGRY